jgi:hypothetical protein
VWVGYNWSLHLTHPELNQSKFVPFSSREYTLGMAAEDIRINSELFSLLAWKMERLEKQLRGTQRDLQETRQKFEQFFVVVTFILVSHFVAFYVYN